MDKSLQLKKLESKMASDKSLPLLKSNLVFGEGDPQAKILFIGEAPGLNEDLEKRPFVGRSGKLLNKTIEGVGWRRSDVYITNIVKRRPPQNRDPLPSEIVAYSPYLKKQIEILKPAVIVPLGRFAMNYFLPKAKISRDQGKVFRADEHLVFPVFHPAAALRNPASMKKFISSMRKLKKFISRPVKAID